MLHTFFCGASFRNDFGNYWLTGWIYSNHQSKRPVWISCRISESDLLHHSIQKIKGGVSGFPSSTTMTQTLNNTAKDSSEERNPLFPLTTPSSIRRQPKIGPASSSCREELWAQSPPLLRREKHSRFPSLTEGFQKSVKGLPLFKSLFRDCLKIDLLFSCRQQGTDMPDIEWSPPDRTRSWET